jgi:hypothetical protein
MRFPAPHRVGIHETVAESTHGTAIECVESNFARRRIHADTFGSFLRRQYDFGRVEGGPALESIARGHLGMPQYIIPMPEGNHSRKSRQSATPSQRWAPMRNHDQHDGEPSRTSAQRVLRWCGRNVRSKRRLDRLEAAASMITAM